MAEPLSAATGKRVEGRAAAEVAERPPRCTQDAGDVSRSVFTPQAATRARGLWRYYLGYALGKMSALVILPVVSRFLGTGGFGRFEAALALLTAAAIVFDAGVGTAIVRYLDGHAPNARLIGAAGVLQFGASLLAMVALLPILIWLAPPGVSIAALFLLVGVFALVEGYAVLGSGLLRARGRDGVYLAFSVCRFVVTVVASVFGARYGGATGALLGTAVGGIGFAIYALVKVVRARSFGTPETRRVVLSYGVPLMATTLMTWSLSLSDRLFLNASVSPQVLGRYAANYRLGNIIIVFFAAPLTLAWMPVVRSATGAAQRKLMSQRWSLIFGFAALGSVIVIIGLASTAVPLVFGRSFHSDYFVIATVGVSGWLGGLYYLVATPVLISDRTTVLARIAASVVVVNMVLNFALITSGGGAHGAALATMLSYLWLCVATMLAVRRDPTHGWLWARAHAIPILALLCGIGLAWAANLWVGLLSLLLALGVAIPYYRTAAGRPSDAASRPVPQ